MYNTDPYKETKPYYINEIAINSIETYDLYQLLSKTFSSKSYDLSQSWKLTKSFNIRNPIFEYEFKDKKIEIEQKYSFPEYWETRYGFLATIKKSILEEVACEGLEVKMCPYNYLGYNIAGVHVSQYADICLTEAQSKIVAGDELILILFKYMIGKRKIVATYNPKVLRAPTPKFDSHICEEIPDPKEKDSLQYIKSMVYLYEFANGDLDPVIRPRHCCPTAALIFKNIPSHDSLNNVPESINMFFAPYQSPLSLSQPTSQHRPYGFKFLQYPESEVKKYPIIVQKNEDIRKAIDTSNEKELYTCAKRINTVDKTWKRVGYEVPYHDAATPKKPVDMTPNCPPKLGLKEKVVDRNDRDLMEWSNLPGVTLERRDKPRIEYIRIEEYMYKSLLTDAWFIPVTQIPNVLKGKAVEDRQLIIRQVDYKSLTCLKDLVLNQITVEISAVNGDIELTNIDCNCKMILPPGTTLRLEADEVKNLEKIQIASLKNGKRTIWAIEIFERDQKTWEKLPSSISHEKLGSVDEECANVSNHLSFLRKKLESSELQLRTRFIDACLAVGEYSSRRLPLATSIMDYNGKVLFSQKITPRGRVADYLKPSHGLDEELIINRMDEPQASETINEILEGTVVVGYRVLDSLKALRVNLSSIYGIRDLSNADVFSDAIKRKSGRFPIRSLTQDYLGLADDFRKFETSTRVEIIRSIYLKSLDKWRDHKLLIPPPAPDPPHEPVDSINILQECSLPRVTRESTQILGKNSDSCGTENNSSVNEDTMKINDNSASNSKASENQTSTQSSIDIKKEEICENEGKNQFTEKQEKEVQEKYSNRILKRRVQKLDQKIESNTNSMIEEPKKRNLQNPDFEKPSEVSVKIEST